MNTTFKNQEPKKNEVSIRTSNGIVIKKVRDTREIEIVEKKPLLEKVIDWLEGEWGS